MLARTGGAGLQSPARCGETKGRQEGRSVSVSSASSLSQQPETLRMCQTDGQTADAEAGGDPENKGD